MTQPMSERMPRTKAGRALLERGALNSRSFALIRPEVIVAIEDEATADEFCNDCGSYDIRQPALASSDTDASPATPLLHQTYEHVSGDLFRCLDCGALGRIASHATPAARQEDQP